MFFQTFHVIKAKKKKTKAKRKMKCCKKKPLQSVLSMKGKGKTNLEDGDEEEEYVGNSGELFKEEDGNEREDVVLVGFGKVGSKTCCPRTIVEEDVSRKFSSRFFFFSFLPKGTSQFSLQSKSQPFYTSSQPSPSPSFSFSFPTLRK